MIRRFFPSTIRHAGGEAFDPTSIGNCEIWFDASDDSTVTREGTYVLGPNTLDLIRTLNDKSGNSRNIEQPTEALRPAVSVITQNGKQLFQSISTGRYLWSQSDFTLSGYPVTFFAVAKQQQGAYCAYSIPTNARARMGFNNNSNILATYQERSGGIVTEGQASESAVQNDFYIYEGISESTTLRKIALNGGVYVENTETLSYVNATRFFLFRTTNQFPVGINDGFFGEVLMYSKVLSSGERTQILTYLASKWGITI